MDLKKFKKYEGKNKCFCSIARSGWVSFSKRLIKEYEIPLCLTCDFLFNKITKEIVLVLHTDKSGNRMVRNSGGSCGTSIMGFVRNNPGFVGYYEMKSIERDDTTVTAKLKKSKVIGGVLNEGFRSKKLDKKAQN